MSFDYTAVADLIQQYQNLNDKLVIVLERLKNVLHTLQTDENWNGEACDYFKEHFYNLMKNDEGLSVAMKNVYLFLEKISYNYESMEKQLSEGFYK